MNNTSFFFFFPTFSFTDAFTVYCNGTLFSGNVDILQTLNCTPVFVSCCLEQHKDRERFPPFNILFFVCFYWIG